jgi:hypothetical protein
LVHLIGLDHRVGKGGAIAVSRGIGLEFVPQLKEVRTAALQLASQLRSRLPIGDSSEDQNKFGRSSAGLAENGTGEHVIDLTAVLATIVQHRFAIKPMDPGIGPSTTGTGESLGMKPSEKFFVAGILVHQVGDREQHGQLSGRMHRW